MRRISLCVLGVFCVVSLSRAADPASSRNSAGASWPQWRGPNRDGTTPDKTPLLDKWPEGGPKLVWKSDIKVPNGRDGGSGSVTVAGGKVFMMAHFNARAKKISITTEELKKWGWAEGVPESLTKPINKACGDFGRKFWGRKAKPEEAEAFANEVLKTLKPEEAKKWGDVIRNYFKVKKVSWKGLRDLATVRDQEFDSIDELNRNIKYVGYGNIFHGHNKDRGPVKGLILEKCYKWVDKVYCLDAAAGKLLWAKEFPGSAANKGTYYFAASCTPSVWEGKLYVTGSMGFRCLDIKNGSVLWEAKTDYSNSSPLLLGGRVYVQAKDLYCFDAKTGKEIWKQTEAASLNSSVAHWTKDGQTLIIAITSKRAIVAVNAGDGSVAWKAGFGKGSNDASPVVAGDILVGRGYSGMSALKLDLKKPSRLWSVKGKVGDRGSTPLVYGDYAYITGSMYGVKSACCIDMKTGEIKWKQKFMKLESTSPIAADGKLFAHVRNPKDKKKTMTVMFKAAPEKYEQLGALEEPAAQFASPVIAAGKLYLRLANGLACYDLRR